VNAIEKAAAAAAAEAMPLVSQVLAVLPPDAVPGFVGCLRHLLAGRPDKAVRLFTLTASTIASKELVKRRFPK
jgi:hypothetical protein